MIYTLTLNPAIDKAVYLDKLTVDAVNRVSYVCHNAGGKGINISRALHVMDVCSIAYGFAGGMDGEKLRHLAAADGITMSLIETNAPTRENVKIVDIKGNTFTDLNEAGGPITSTETEQLLHCLSEKVRPGDIIALSGSIPCGISKNIYAQITKMMKKQSVLVMVDCDGDALSNCVSALPDVIKPNNFELAALVKRPLPNNTAIIAAARELVSFGVGTILITLGGDGALSVSKKGVFHAAGMNVPVLSTVGAGDTFLAGYINAVTRGEEADEALARAMSAATAKVQCEGTDMPSRSHLEEYISTLKIERL